MSFEEALNYLLFTNPISSYTTSALSKTSQVITSKVQGLMPVPKQQTNIIKMDPEPLWKLASKSSIFVRMAGVCGASAVMIGAYGAHAILPDNEKDPNLKKVFETANRYHFLHTLALLGVPMCRYPLVSGSFFLLGLLMFCGSCYHTAITGDHRLRRITPIGGTCFILGWLTMAL